MKRFSINPMCALLLLSGISTVQAQEAEEDLALIYGDKNSISIATGSQQSLRRAPAVATVITAEEIAAMGATDIDEVLESVPGIHVTRTAIRYAPTYVIRGIYNGTNNTQVLLLQNGIPTTTMYSGDKGAVWTGVPVENIARIEVIRGPGSALYGADAYAGVINIITKSAADTPGTEIGMRAGSFNTRSAWIQHGGEIGAVEVAAFLRIGATDGIQEILQADAQTRNDKIFGTSASLAPGPVNTGYDAIDASLNLAYDKWRLRAAYKLRDELETGAGISSALDPNSYGRAENVSGDLTWSSPHFARNWSLEARAAFQYYTFTYPTNLQLLPPGLRLPSGAFPDGLIGGPNSWDKQFRFSGNATYSGFAGHSLRLGLGYDDLDLYRTKTIKNNLLNAAGAPTQPGPVMDYSGIQPFIKPQQRRVDYLYLQDEWDFAQDWTLTAGVRHDHYSDFGGTTNPRLALVWNTTLDLTTKLLFGQAFRAPSFAEQYAINPVTNGNPDLKPETIQTLEAAFSWRWRRDSQINLSLFRYEMRDIIRLVNNTTPALGATYQNTGSQHGNGLELEAEWSITPTLHLIGAYSYQKSVDDATGKDAGYAPHHRVYLRGDWRYRSGWIASIQANHVADRERAAGDTRPQIADYTTVDITLRNDMGRKEQWGYAASLRNLFAADVREPSLAPGLALPYDLPMAPRSVWVQATYRM
jgi:iron complex outermembrane receptor protein